MLLLFLPLAYSGEPNQTEVEFIFMVQCVSLQQSNSTIKDSSSLTWVQVEDMNSCSCVSGLELTFYSGVYGTCIGAMTGFGQDAKSLIGISGIFIGVGEILGETSQPWTSSLTPGSRRCVILFFFLVLPLFGQEGAYLGCWTRTTVLAGTLWFCLVSSLTLWPFTWFSSTSRVTLRSPPRQEPISRPSLHPSKK